MTRYEQGFLNKCAEYGVDEKVASFLLKNAGAGDVISGTGDFLRTAGGKVGDFLNNVGSNVSKDHLNYGVIPGLAGAAGGYLLGDLISGDDPRKRRINQILMALLGGAGAIAAKSSGYGLPNVALQE